MSLGYCVADPQNQRDQSSNRRSRERSARDGRFAGLRPRRRRRLAGTVLFVPVLGSKQGGSDKSARAALPPTDFSPAHSGTATAGQPEGAAESPGRTTVGPERDADGVRWSGGRGRRENQCCHSSKLAGDCSTTGVAERRREPLFFRFDGADGAWATEEGLEYMGVERLTSRVFGYRRARVGFCEDFLVGA